jgi:hypothetical protein
MSFVPIVVNIINQKYRQIRAYIARVARDGGLIRNQSISQQYYQLIKQNNLPTPVFSWFGEAGTKERVSGIYSFATKIFSTHTPVARYGPELVVNGGFDTDSGWTKNTWSIGSGVASINTVGIDTIYQPILTIGKTYKLTYTLVSCTSGGVRGRIGTLADGTLGQNTPGVYSFTRIADSSILGVITGSSGFNGSIDNISVVEVLNSLDGSPTDAVQTTSTSQPPIGGYIAPNEKIHIKNPNGDSRYMTHPTISFSAGDAWSVTTVLNWNGNSDTYSSVFGSTITTTKILIRSVNNNRIRIFGNTTDVSGTSDYLGRFIGKRIVISLVYKAPNVGFYINDLFIQSLTINDAFTFNAILRGDNSESYPYNGSLFAHIITPAALTPTQVAIQANFLSQQYPEIPSVTIGSQPWATSNCEMVSTPIGSLIAEVQSNANVEKITNHTFTDAIGWAVTGETIISGGTARVLSSTGVLSNLQGISGVTLKLGQWYKIIYDVISTNGVNLTNNIGDFSYNTSTTGTGRTQYFKCVETTLNFKRVGITDVTLDNIYLEEIGWSSSQELYDAIYAQTAGTVEEKTYAAVKAAAMWCYYNNDLALGSVYGKLINWYSVYLLHKDLVYYAMTGSNVVASAYNASKVYIVRINARTSGAGTVSINATGRGYSNVITLSGTDKLYEIYVNGADGVIPTLTYTGTGSMTVTEFSMYEDLWKWRVPAETDFNNLSTNLGGTSVAGGKMKKDGLLYWNTPNTGADNSSGFSMLPSGSRLDDGTFAGINSIGNCNSISATDASNAYIMGLFNTDTTIAIVTTSKKRGRGLRLIKS